jgi:hypothetical protein
MSAFIGAATGLVFGYLNVCGDSEVHRTGAPGEDIQQLIGFTVLFSIFAVLLRASIELVRYSRGMK